MSELVNGKAKRGYLGAWDAIVVLGVLALGLNSLDNYLSKKTSVTVKEKELMIERENTKQKELDEKVSQNNKNNKK